MSWIRKITGAMVSAMLLAGITATAWSAPATLPQTVLPGPGALAWEVTNDGGTDTGDAFNGNCDGSPGLTIHDATATGGATDAYDSAWQIYVDGQIFIAPDPVDLTGNVITAGPALVGVPGLPVTVEYLFSDTVQAARIRAIFENMTGNPIDITVEVPVNFGSDAATVVNATGSGDLLFTVNDQWLVTSDGAPAGDPVNTTVLYGVTNPPVLPTMVTSTVCISSGNEGAGVTYQVTIPANSVRSLMFFAGLGDIIGPANTIAGAIANAGVFDDPATIDASLVGDLTNLDWDETLNWRFVRQGAVGVNAGGGGGGGGCTLQAARAFDPFFPTLLAGLALAVCRRRRG